MKYLPFAAALVVAATLAGGASARSTFAVWSLSDGHVGSAKTELLAQRAYSLRVVHRLAGSWRVAPRHATCWSRVPWAKTCDRARRKLLAHRWLYRLAATRLDRLYPATTVASSFWQQAMCVHSHEGAWNDAGYFGGGLQFLVSTWNTAARLSGGRVPYVSSTADIGRQPIATQVYAASVIVAYDGSWREWPNTARDCGLL